MLHKPFVVAALLAVSGGGFAWLRVRPHFRARPRVERFIMIVLIDEMKKSYEQRIAALEQKLAQAEAESKDKAPSPASEKPVASDSGQRTTLAASAAFNPEVSLILQGQYAQMKDVPDRTITGFWPAGGHDHDGGKGVSTRGFSLNHTELIFSGGIDPYWRGQAILAVQDESVEVEEAWFQSLAIGHGVGLRGGRFRSGIGYLNEQHPHQ